MPPDVLFPQTRVSGQLCGQKCCAPQDTGFPGRTGNPIQSSRVLLEVSFLTYDAVQVVREESFIPFFTQKKKKKPLLPRFPAVQIIHKHILSGFHNNPVKDILLLLFGRCWLTAQKYQIVCQISQSQKKCRVGNKTQIDES